LLDDVTSESCESELEIELVSREEMEDAKHVPRRDLHWGRLKGRGKEEAIGTKWRERDDIKDLVALGVRSNCCGQSSV
jgi:hypothetical protein